MEKKTSGNTVGYVYSTASNDQMITNYTERKEGQVQSITGQVLIMGGANVMAHGAKAAMITPLGVATPINKEEKAILDASDSFKKFVADKYMTFSEKKEDADKAVRGVLEDKDESAPVTEAGSTRGGKKQTKQKNIVDAQKADK
ncbi:MAG: hypothetical protein GY779_16885 [Gammaproteobacteria bacterium]|nr:hypothetical protein [Gammaproteobacteria bacterium]